MMISGFCVNFLYFLLCGLCFKRNKILWGIAISIGISMLLSLLAGPALNQTDFEGVPEIDSVFRSLSICFTVVAVLLAGGIFYRIKTIKH